MGVKINNLEEWLRADLGEGHTKEASADYADVSESEEALLEKLASEFEDEQFMKLSNDSWMMGQIIGESIITTLNNHFEKVAIEDVDPRISGDIGESMQGEAPMMAQKVEDEKAPPGWEGSHTESVVQKLINKTVGTGASTAGSDPEQPGGQQIDSPGGPQSGNVEQTSMDVAQKKVANFVAARKLASEGVFDKEAAKDILRDLIKNKLES